MSAGRIAVAMSGGVDSSVAAAVLKEAGHDLVGFSMQLWDQRRSSAAEGEAAAGRCCSTDDLYDAREVARRLGFPHYVINFQEEFQASVVRSFIEGYRRGETPSPCVLCNSTVKFDHLVRVAEEVEATHVATGHYARVARDPSSGAHLLLKGRDAARDQSYFLFGLRQEQLARALFPLGERTKPEVRDIARSRGLAVADKADSQEICFVPDGDYAAFVERHYAEVCGEEPQAEAFPSGPIVDTAGVELGTHRGIHRFTVGQRRGLGVAAAKPLYVVALEPEANRVVVGERGELLGRSCRAVGVSWIAGRPPVGPVRAAVKIRSRHPEAPAAVEPLEDGSVRIVFDAEQLAITPGQAAVFYDGETVLGGGWIAR